MRIIICGILLLLSASLAFAQPNLALLVNPPRKYANAAERILNDPTFTFDDAKVEQAEWADVRKARAEQKAEAVKVARKAKQQKGTTNTASTPKPRKRYNHVHPMPPIAAYQMAWARAGYARANSSNVFVGPVIRPR